MERWLFDEIKESLFIFGGCDNDMVVLQVFFLMTILQRYILLIYRLNDMSAFKIIQDWGGNISGNRSNKIGHVLIILEAR